MQPTSLTGPVYTLSPSVKANKQSGSSIKDYIDATPQPSSAFNQAVAAADEAARASSTTQGKSVQDYVAANRSVFNFTSSANGSNGDGKSIEDYRSGSSAAASSASSAASTSAASLISSLGDNTTQGKTFQDYVNAAEGTASSTASSASSAASSAAATAQQNAANSTTGMTIQSYISAAEGTSTP